MLVEIGFQICFRKKTYKNDILPPPGSIDQPIFREGKKRGFVGFNDQQNLPAIGGIL